MDGRRATVAVNSQRVYRAAHASLRIVGESLDPSEVTRRLRLPPDHVHRKGDLRITRAKSGKVQEADPYSTGMWSMSSRRWVESPRVETHVRWILDQLAPCAGPLARLLSGDAGADIFCFSSGATSEPPTVSRALRDRARALGLGIEIDHYEE